MLYLQAPTTKLPTSLVRLDAYWRMGIGVNLGQENCISWVRVSQMMQSDCFSRSILEKRAGLPP